MNSFFKKFLAFTLAFVCALGLFAFNIQSAFAADRLGVYDAQNGSFVLEFPKSTEKIVPTGFINMEYSTNNTTWKNFRIDDVSNFKDTDTSYDWLVEYDFDYYFGKIETRKELYIRGEYEFKNGDTVDIFVPFTASTTTGDNTFTLISPEINSIIVKFNEDKGNLTSKDFTVTSTIGNSTKNLDVSVSSVTGYKERYKLKFSDLPTSSTTKSVKLTVKYKNETNSKTFTLYSDGTIVDYDLAAEYSDLKPAIFSILNLKNGELRVRFDEEPRTTLRTSDFKVECYIDGSYKNLVDITKIEKDGTSGKDYYLYFDNISATNKKQIISLLVFYKGDGNRQPAIENFKIDEEEYVNEVAISVKSIKDFDKKVTIPEVTIKEKGTNVIYYCTKSRVEYIKLEAPEGFEWTERADVTGSDGLKNVIDYDVKYDTSGSKDQKNVLLVGIINAERDRTKIGTLYINNLELTATEDADLGDVKVKISGAGIPYEKISFANLIKKETEKPEDPKEPSATEYVVVVVDGFSQMIVNGTTVTMDTKPFITNNRFVLPVSHIAVAFGVPATQENINWDPVNRKVKVIDGDTTVELAIGSNIMLVNGVPQNMDTPALISDNRTFIPMRSLAEALGFVVSWNPTTRTATLTKVMK